MGNDLKFYIDGAWAEPAHRRPFEVLNPATEQPAGLVSMGSSLDVDRAVAAARRAFQDYSTTTPSERLDLLRRIAEKYRARYQDLARAITREMGCPATFAAQAQVPNALAHFEELSAVLKDYEFERFLGDTLIRREPIGVCGLITPWNWPLMQITAKLAPALAAGCTVVLKPSEHAPLSAIILAEIIHEAGVPPGVFNLVNGDGAGVGSAISAHPDIDMVSFTGSTRAGILIAKAAADSVKRVTQELGGKSANIILPDADLQAIVPADVHKCFVNAGQNCQAPTRMIVHRSQREAVESLAGRAAADVRLGDPSHQQTTMGPLVSKGQFERVQALIRQGVQEGARLICGGPGRPADFDRGYYTRPTIFTDVTPQMRIAREEIFGPVLSIMVYDTEDEAVAIANGTSYGLAGFVHSADIDRARRVAARLRAGRVYLNGAAADRRAPFGGYKQSGNGRENGVFGLEEYLEVKAVLGYRTA